MRSRILTEWESQNLEQFLKSETKIDRVLKMRIKRNFEKLRKDFKLIESTFEKF